MRSERLIYTFVSMAYYAASPWGHGVPVDGSDRIAGVAHKNGIPVTWIVNSGSIKVLAERINSWHEQYGDDVILLLEHHLPDNGHEEDFKQVTDSEWRELKEAFPWVETKVGAAGVISNTMIQTLEELEFKGLWGYCWEQSWWDEITHKGAPWGFWYINSGRYKAPHTGKGRITACEWTARDLNLAYHTASPCIYSTDPWDVLRAGLCTGENIEYWKKLFNDYIYNTDKNEFVYFTQQQESHEMDVTDAFEIMPASDILESEKMLDNFFKYIKGFNITIMTLPSAIEHYQSSNQQTAPCYMLTQDSDIRPEINKYTMTLGGVGSGPWPETFLYYDAQCQMAFVKGECRPRMLRNYTSNSKSDDDFDETVPMVIVEEKASTYERTENFIKIVFSINHKKPIPFGLVYWDDLTGFSVDECEGTLEAKVLENKLVFIRFNLTGEEKIIQLTLKKQ
jgi:hypothetical protein